MKNFIIPAIFLVSLLSFSYSANSQGIPCTNATTTVTVTLSSATSPQRLGRLFRDGVQSTCPNKACPGDFNTTSTYNYEVAGPYYNLSSSDACITLNNNTGNCGAAVHSVAYLNFFDPNNICTNYLGDVGGSISQPYSFVVPAGESFVVLSIANFGIEDCTSSFTLQSDQSEGLGCSASAIPTMSEWGLILFGLLLATLVSLSFYRKSRTAIA